MVRFFQEYELCVVAERYELQYPEFYSIRHTRIGEPMRVFKIKRNDTAPTLTVILADENQEPVELTSLNDIKFIMRQKFYYDRDEEQLKVQSSSGISIAPQDRARGKFQYNWAVGDTDEVGDYTGEFQITLNGTESGASEPYDLANGQTLQLEVNEGAVQTFTFATADFVNINEATAAEIKAILDLTITDAQVILSDDSKRLLIQTTTTDLSGSVQITGGTSNDALIFDTSLKQNRRISMPEKGLLIQVLKDLDEN